MTSQRVWVILGGGAAGSLLAFKLSTILKTHNIELILIDSQSYHEYTPSIINAWLQSTNIKMDSKLKEISWDYKIWLNKYNVKFLQEEVVDVKEEKDMSIHTLHFKSGNQLSFEKLFVCTGTSYPSPFKRPVQTMSFEARSNQLKNYHQTISNASTILCIGGGAVGVELIGELAIRYPQKEIIVVHKGEHLLNSFEGDLGLKAEKALKEIHTNLRIILGQKATPKGVLNEYGGGTYSLEDGETFDCDLCIQAQGLQPNTEFLKELATTYNQEFQLLDERGFILTDTSFCSQLPWLYAIGDVASLPFNETKLYYTAHLHAILLATNLKRSFQNLHPIPYQGSRIVSLISIGPHLALAYLWDGLICYSGFLKGFKKTKYASFLASRGKWIVEKISSSSILTTWLNDVFYYTMLK